MTLDPKTLATFAILIHLAMRLLKVGDLAKLIPGRARPLVALVLGALAMGVDAAVAGTPLPEAALTAALAVGAAMLGHDVFVESLRGGKEILG